MLRDFGSSAQVGSKTGSYHIQYPMSETQWDKMLTNATTEMTERPDQLSKVVLSRVCEMRASDGRDIDVDSALNYLNEHYRLLPLFV